MVQCRDRAHYMFDVKRWSEDPSHFPRPTPATAKLLAFQQLKTCKSPAGCYPRDGTQKA
ncbi:hypothetical protein GCM10007338_05960 [Corynebacterium pelargi]|nr:hypothetical protein GCM10007338_05960 [Corynebacterium pelargi]